MVKSNKFSREKLWITGSQAWDRAHYSLNCLIALELGLKLGKKLTKNRDSQYISSEMRWALRAPISTSDSPLDAAGSELSIARRISAVRQTWECAAPFFWKPNKTVEFSAKCAHKVPELDCSPETSLNHDFSAMFFRHYLKKSARSVGWKLWNFTQTFGWTGFSLFGIRFFSGFPFTHCTANLATNIRRL